MDLKLTGKSDRKSSDGELVDKSKRSKQPVMERGKKDIIRLRCSYYLDNF